MSVPEIESSIQGMETMMAPVALFVYNRPAHTRKTIEALLKNIGAADTDLFIFSDAPSKPEAQAGVMEVREYIESIRGFRSLRVIHREVNYGLARSIVEGVTMLCNEYGRAIVLEDDLVTSPWFLTFMNDALSYYQEDERVASIHGYMFPVECGLPETFFIRDPGCWGWATWQRAWDLFEADGNKLLVQLKQRRLEKEFNFSNSYDYIGMLEGQVAGINDSWAVRWYASVFLLGKLSLYPGRSLVSNIGNDGSGRHGGETTRFNGNLTSDRISVGGAPVEENLLVRTALIQYLRSLQQTFLQRAWNFVSRRFFKVLSATVKR